MPKTLEFKGVGGLQAVEAASEEATSGGGQESKEVGRFPLAMEPSKGTVGAVKVWRATVVWEQEEHLTENDYPALAKVWDNDEDDVFDKL